jgi:hypothetical protein
MSRMGSLANEPLMRLVLQDYLYKSDLEDMLADLSDNITGTVPQLANRLLDNPHFDPQVAFQKLRMWQLRELCHQRGKPSDGPREELVEGLRQALRDEETTSGRKLQRTAGRRGGTVERTFMGRTLVPKVVVNQFFVAYPYGMNGAANYRASFEKVGQVVGKKPVFADERITHEHLLYKIAQMILDSPICIFDVTEWNPNVTLELGIAYGFESKAYIAFDPTKLSKDVPADIRGLDRIQYQSLPDLEAKLTKVLTES